jgi:Recombination endonuclease VII
MPKQSTITADEFVAYVPPERWQVFPGETFFFLEAASSPYYVRKSVQIVDCDCICGKRVPVRCNNLIRGVSGSCGCRFLERSGRNNFQVDADGMKICCRCREKKNVKTDFYSWTTTTDGHCPYCKNCWRHFNYKRNYGLSLEDYNAMLAHQDDKCACCHGIKTEVVTNKNGHLFVDHCHQTGQVRGLVCGPCNTMLGLMKDSPERCVYIGACMSEYLRNTNEAPAR